jgi:hypothetical protein
MKYSGHFMILNSGIFFICSNMQRQPLGFYIFFGIACFFFLCGIFLLLCGFIKFIDSKTPKEE